MLTKPLTSHALVIGGSISGLLAARVLADHFERVTIVERDRLPQDPLSRKGVPHARHRHQLLMGGRLILEQIFPGIEADLAQAGTIVVDWSKTIAPLTPVAPGPYFGCGYNVLYCSRDLLEWAIRRRVMLLPHVCICQERDVVGLVADETGSAVSGVRIRARGAAAEEGEETLHADLIVDASGRYSQTPKWLTALGHAIPQETIVNSFVRYVSRYYRYPSDHLPNWQVVLSETATRGGLIAQVEGNRWLLTLSGVGGDYPPLKEAAVLAFVQSLPSQQLYEFLQVAYPISPLSGYQQMENRLRHYEQLQRQPEHFIVLGDACCTLNPQNSQGITVAAQSALVLDSCLRRRRNSGPAHLTGFTQQFQQALAKNNRAAWLLATSRDFRYSTTVGERPQWLPLYQRYMSRVGRLAAKDAQVHGVLFAVTQLLKPPDILFRPRVLTKVLRQRFLQH